MSANTEQRKLAAIMFTDMVGYSALAQRNEALALELLEEHRRVVRGILPQHTGREVKTTGDGFLLEFPSALAAVQCAVALQQALHERNQVSPAERRLRIRIGIHVGDVVLREGDIHGDGVNIAARIEPLAPAGGICISSAVHEQVRNKLSQPMAALGSAELKNIELPMVVHRVVMPWEDAGTTSLPRARRRGHATAGKLALPLVGALALALCLWFWSPWKKSATPVAREPAKPTEAQKLRKQALALIDEDPLAVRENYRLAEELAQRAVQLDPTDAEAWATLARASLNMVFGRYDNTPVRRDSARSQAERAIRLAPDSVEAGLAMAGYLLISRQFVEAERRAKDLLRRFPADQRVVELLARSLDLQNRAAEARDILRQHAHTPAGLVSFLDREAYDRFDKNDLVEADALLDRAFAGKPDASAYLTRLLVLWTGWGDLPAAAKFLENIPSQLLLEDAFAHHAANIWMELGQTEKALEALRRIPREFLEEKRVIRPKGLVAGRILQAAGRTAAAEVDWKQALVLVERRLAAEPGRADWVRLKALLLAHLGEHPEARKQLKLCQEMSGAAASEEAIRSIEVQMALGDREEVIRWLQSVITSRKGRWLNWLNLLRHAPLYAPIRSDPRVQEMITNGERWLKDLRAGKAPNAGKAGAASSALDKNFGAVLEGSVGNEPRVQRY